MSRERDRDPRPDRPVSAHAVCFVHCNGEEGACLTQLCCVQVFCGNFEYDAPERDILRLFEKYGPVTRIDMKTGAWMTWLYAS